MKRVAIRIAALTAVVGVGIGGVTQAQRFLRARAAAESKQQADGLANASKLLAEMSANGETDSSGDADPFARDTAAAGARYAERVPVALEAEDPSLAYTERPESDSESPATTRGQSFDDPAPRDEPGQFEPDDHVAPLGGRGLQAAPPAVAATRYNEPGQLPPETEVDEGEAPLAADVEEPVAEAPDAEIEPTRIEPLGEDSTDAVPQNQPGYAPAAMRDPVSSRRTAVPADEDGLEGEQVSPRTLGAAVPVEDPEADGVPLADAAAEDPAGSSGGVEGSGRPGTRELEGPQQHALELEKHFPADAQVGKPAEIAIKLRNAGSAVARRLEIVDAVPQGTRLVATRPQADLDARGAVRWAIAELKPGEETNVTMEVLPLVEGELGSVATVHYAAEASAKAVVTRPVLSLKVEGPQQVMIGADATYVVHLTNTGTGVARGIVLGDRIPEGLSHPSGSELERGVADLRPGESHKVQLTLTAAKAGRYLNVISAIGEGEARAENRSEIEVVAPDLTVELGGGMRRYLERPAKFTLAIANHGTAAARGVEIQVELPPGLEFLEATHYGQYEPRTRTVRWSLEELPAGQSGAVELTLNPVAEGEHQLAIRALGQPLASFEKQQAVSVEGIASTMFEVVDVEDPVEEGGATSYEVRVVNQGTKSASNVRVVALLPEGLEPLDAQGPTRHQIDGQRVVFDPIERLAPKADTTFQIKVKAQRAGEMRVQMQLMTDDMESPLTKEESTRVFSNK
ncbi:MAG: DUF11 domain-containing protein [Planctomycetaceae bacterium]|nr:DUF11 domain-containing protein [Planctomycetaceae bacterium]